MLQQHPPRSSPDGEFNVRVSVLGVVLVVELLEGGDVLGVVLMHLKK